ncbi:MAG: hypothetical protein EXR21_08305 [Flavobacteriaceae bacterium]|nr:hypothetical protein [Flavobacteriaceae bacterium]
MKKLLYRSLLFATLSLGLLYLADFIFTQTLRNDPLNKVAFARQFSNNTFDFAFLGNSRVLVMSRTKELEKRTGKRGINLGLDGSNLMHQSLILSDFLKENSVNNLYMNLDPWGLQLNMNNTARIWCFMPFINDVNVYRNFKNIFGAKQADLWRYAPFARYAYFNSRQGPVSVINSEISFMPKSYNENGDLKRISNKVIPIKKIRGDKAGRILVNKDNLLYLRKILELCREKNVKLHVYTAPAFLPHYQKYSNIDSLLNTILLPLLAKYDANYTNFCIKPFCSDTSLFYDLHHLNKKGIEQFTSMLQKLIE